MGIINITNNINLVQQTTPRGNEYWTSVFGEVIGIKCTQCNKVKEVEDFGTHRTSLLKRTGKCKKCLAKQVKQCVKDQKEKKRKEGTFSLSEVLEKGRIGEQFRVKSTISERMEGTVFVVANINGYKTLKFREDRFDTSPKYVKSDDSVPKMFPWVLQARYEKVPLVKYIKSADYRNVRGIFEIYMKKDGKFVSVTPQTSLSELGINSIDELTQLDLYFKELPDGTKERKKVAK